MSVVIASHASKPQVMHTCIYTVNRKKCTKMFLIYSLQNLTDC